MSTSILPGERPDRLEEESAVLGVFAPGEDVARMTCFGLQALQHRGQESAGIAVGDGETFMVSKDLGLVTQVFDESRLAALEGYVAVGHARYSTSGAAASWEAAQPHISAITSIVLSVLSKSFSAAVIRSSLTDFITEQCIILLKDVHNAVLERKKLSAISCRSSFLL